MKSGMYKYLMNLLAVVAIACVPATALAASGKFERDIAVDGAAVVRVSNESGAVTVSGGDVDKVSIRARIKIDKKLASRNPVKAQEIIDRFKRKPPIVVSDNIIEISKLQRSSHQKYASVSYTIIVPRDSDVEITSVSGNVRVTGVTGEVNATSDTGKVSLADSTPKSKDAPTA